LRLLSRPGPIKEAAWVLLGQGLAFLGGLAGIKLLTNLMPAESYGELALGVSIAGIVNMFLFGPLGQVVFRFYSSCRENGDTTTYAAVLVRLHRQVIALLVAICVPLVVLVGIALGWRWALLLAIAITFGVLSGVQGSLSSLISALRDRKMAALTQGLDTWLRLGFAAAMTALWASSQGHWAIVGYAIGSLVVIAIQLSVARRHDFQNDPTSSEDGLDRVLRGEFLKYALPFVSFAGLASISQYADRWLLQTFSTAADVGIYTAMLQLASAPVALLMGAAAQLIIPVVFARSGNLEDHDRTRSSRRLLIRSVLIMGVGYIIVTLAAYKWGEVLVTLLTNVEYARYASFLWMIVLSQAVFNLAQFMVAMGLTLNRPLAYFAPKLGQAVCLVLAGVLLVRTGGVNGLAEALLASSAVYLAWVIVVNTRLWREHVRANTQLG
jgi:O-antigen/teichoic acid export membrane protein